MRHASRSLSLSLLARALVSGPSAAAAQFTAPHPVHWRLVRSAGGDVAHVQLRLNATMDAGWYIYSLTQPPGGPMRTTVALAPGGPLVQAGDVKAPRPTRHLDPSFGFDLETYPGAVAFGIPAQPAPGIGAVAAQVRFQACNDRICLPPHTETVPLDPVGAARR